MRRKLLFILLIAGLTHAQPSHLSMSAELLKDFQQFIADSSTIPRDQQILIFSGEAQTVNYYGGIINKLGVSADDMAGDTIYVEVISTTISIDKDSSKTSRNTEYIRQLKLDVNYTIDRDVIAWKGNISDKIEKKELSPLLKEWFPVPITGNYRTTQPSSLIVIVTTLGTLALVSTLFFIRT
jgi:hypothetical protein